MVPMDQPKAALEMLERWMAGTLSENITKPESLLSSMWFPGSISPNFMTLFVNMYACIFLYHAIKTEKYNTISP